MTIEVYKEPLYRRYYTSSPWSLACAYMAVVSVLVIFLPLFFGYNSTSFWLKDNTLYEQPHVQYSYQVVCQFYGDRYTITNGVTTSTERFRLYWSTETLLNELHNEMLRPALISSSVEDTDRNGLMDKLALSVTLPLSSRSVTSNATTQIHESVTGLDMLVFYEVRVQDRAKYIVDAVTHFPYRNGGDAMGKLFVDGNLALKQREKLQVKGGFQRPYQDDPLLPVMYEDTSLQSVKMSTILAKNAARNLSLALDLNHIYAEPESGTGNFIADFQLRVPHQYLVYSPGASEVLKAAWVQYLSLFLVISFLLSRMSSFVFTHGLLYANQVPDMVVRKMD